MLEVIGITSFDDRAKLDYNPSFSKRERTNELKLSRIICFFVLILSPPPITKNPLAQLANHIFPPNSAEGVTATKLAWEILTQDWEY